MKNTSFEVPYVAHLLTSEISSQTPLISVLPLKEVKNAWNYTSIPPVRLHGVVLS
jgi:hypothetical protein